MLGSAARGPDIAIVGMACRFPGARNTNEYWNLLANPKPQFARVPESRWRHRSFLSDDDQDPHSAYCDRMATIADVAAFDAVHYRIPPQRARAMDPQHRLLIDLTREAIQDAGWEAGGFDRAETSVVMGLSDSGYREVSTVNLRLRQLASGEFGRAIDDPRMLEAGRGVEPFHGTALPGLLLSMGPGAISSVFGLHGESYALDAACSSGLAAVANAVSALRSGRCQIAVAGAAQLILAPDLLVGLCRIGAISRMGECRPFDRRADGLVLGEGGGVLVLRPLGAALDAGDRIYAVIRGVGLSNDGTVHGGMTPQAGGQLLALRRAYADAGVSPGSVGYIEAHGAATSVGDRVEATALRELRAGASAPAYLGAAKAVIGHALVASGIAGLIKTVLVVHKRHIVPQPEFESAAHLGLDAAGLEIPTALTEWREPDSHPRRAGVSAFGFGGTNAHIVLEEVSETLTQRAAPQAGPALLVLSARDRDGLGRYAGELAAVMAEERLPLSTVAATLTGRQPLACRLAVVADSAEDAIEKLSTAGSLLAWKPDGELAAGVIAGSVRPRAAAAVETVRLSGSDALGSAVSASDALGSDALGKRGVLGQVARRFVTDAGVRLTMERVPPCTLPPSPLSRQEHWIVNRREADRTADPIVAASREGAAPVVAAPHEHAASLHEHAGAPRRRSRTLPVVHRAVAIISSFPASELRVDQRLVADLGFDSLMLRELQARLEEAGLEAAVPTDLVQGDFTVGEIVALIDGERAEQDHDQLHGYACDQAPDQLHGQPQSQPQAVVVPEGDRLVSWDASTAVMEEFPEVQGFEARHEHLASLGLPLPYFRVHGGNVRNTTVIDEKKYLSFSGYNYLGLSGHPVVNEAVCAAVERYGSSVSASRVLGGERALTQQLERELASLLCTEDCLALVSGHATNVTAIGHIVSAKDLIVHDALAHDSILQGCALSGARRRPFSHNDCDHLEFVLRQTRSQSRRVLVVVEGAYSMDGDLVDLPRVIELKKKYGAILMIDEAHSLGTVGRHGGGVGEFFGVDRSDVDLWMGTLSKSLASCGGYLAGTTRVIRWLKYTLPGFVYSVGLTPPNAAAALAALQLMKSEPSRLASLHRNSELFLKLARDVGVATGSSGNSPVVPCILGDSQKTLQLAMNLFDCGIVVDPILHPAVNEREARLRFFITSEHTEHEIRYAVSMLGEELLRVAGQLD